MFKHAILSLVVILVIAGCAWQTNLLNNKQSLAIETTLSRARFEMDCQDATGSVLSRTVTEPLYYRGFGTYGDWYQDARAVYTIGITGCGKRGTYITTCPDGSIGCFAALARPYDSKYNLSELARQ